MVKVSILMPTLNTAPFLKARFDSIFQQTYQDWELIIVDSYSDDGSWEIIQKYASEDARIHISQAPRKGVYAGLNGCIKQARGEYIYIAMSDDTMEPDSVKTMVSEMDAHPECDICHTCLKVIDVEGNEVEGWWSNTLPFLFYGKLMQEKHVRLAPYDGVLYLALRTVYISLTQLFIRHSLFEQVGLFMTDIGPQADFEWGMRAALCSNTLHIPKTLATWRIHPKQLTQKQTDIDICNKLSEMSEIALDHFKAHDFGMYKRIINSNVHNHYKNQSMSLRLSECPSLREKARFLFKEWMSSPAYCSRFVLGKIKNLPKHRNQMDLIYETLAEIGIDNNVKTCL